MKSERIWLALPAAALALAVSHSASPANTPVPFSEIGQRATADYHGDALAVTTTPEGALLRCGFQKLEGRATAEGLWLESTAAGGGKFRLVAMAVGRQDGGDRTSSIQHPTSNWRLPARPRVSTHFGSTTVSPFT